MSADDTTAALETARQVAETAAQTIRTLSRKLGRAYAELDGTGQDTGPVLRLLDSLEEAASHAAAMQFKAEMREAYLTRADRDDVDDDLAQWAVRQLLASPAGFGTWAGAPANPAGRRRKPCATCWVSLRRWAGSAVSWFAGSKSPTVRDSTPIWLGMRRPSPVIDNP